MVIEAVYSYAAYFEVIDLQIKLLELIQLFINFVISSHFFIVFSVVLPETLGPRGPLWTL